MSTLCEPANELNEQNCLTLMKRFGVAVDLIGGLESVSSEGTETVQ